MPTIKLVSPVDGSIHAERTPLTLEAAQAAVAGARAAQGPWATRPLEERIKTVLAGIDALEAMTPQIVPELAWQMGRPVRYGGEFRGVRERADYMAGIAASALADEVVEDSAAFTRLIAREALGVVFVIAPWNYPFLTAVNTIVPALIAGNAVVLKHASQTLLAGERLAEALHKGGVPEDVFRNVVLDHGTTEALIAGRAFDFVNFTGSVGGGRAIERAAAGTFTGTGLELGGKDPGYVRADADLDAAVDGLMDGAMFNSGQCCCGIERIYVHESLYDAFVEKAVSWVRGQRLGNPLEEATTMGPMAHERFAAVVRAQTAEAVAKGARALIDVAEFPADDGGAYLAPQILVDVTHDMRVMREESFGPVVGIMPVRDDAEAIRLMNDCDYGLTVSIWTGDASAARAIGAQMQTGTVLMNRCDYLDPALCWTGCKDTGRGAALSHLGYQALTRPKSYHLKKA
jgi:acyl-CoA reductase-like NAD-dependent aldehyde dehydrogenase